MPNCVVNGCTPKSREWETGVILHTFPKDRTMIKKWLQATGQEYADIDKEIDKIVESKHNTYRMCSLHFSEEYYLTNPLTGKKKLMPIAVPSIFQPKLIEVKATDNVIFLQAVKRRRCDEEGIASAQFMPGELCPTCQHVIPHTIQNVIPHAIQNVIPHTIQHVIPHAILLPNPSVARKRFVDKATSFDPSWGTQAKSVQATVRTFSTRIQCNRLRHRKMTAPRRSTVSRPFVFTGTAWVRASETSTPQDTAVQATEEPSSSEETESTDEQSSEETEEEEDAPETRRPVGPMRGDRPSLPIEDAHSSPEEKPSFSTITIGSNSTKQESSFHISRADSGPTPAEGVPSVLSNQIVHLLQILSLTLEVIYLLTGEDYKVVKTSGECVTQRRSKNQSPIMAPPPQGLIRPKGNEQKILQFINEILKMLTGEIDEHITVKVEATERDEEYYRGDVPCKEEEIPVDIRTDGSYGSDTPKCNPSHLHDVTLDGCENNQIDEHITVKVEATEGDEEYYRGDVLCKEEEIPTEIRTDGSYGSDTPKCNPSHLHDVTLDGCENNQIDEHITVKVEATEGDEEYYRGDVPCKEEEIPTEIRTGE